jgi:hypothetical protein
MNYSAAEDVRKIAREMMGEGKPHSRLVNVPIEYLFMDGIPKKGGMAVWGKTEKVGGLHAYLAKGGMCDFFVILIAEPMWRDLTAEQRIALVDHELCHCGEDVDKGTLAVIPHDVEEFVGVVSRHGLWRKALDRFVGGVGKTAQTTFEFNDEGINEETGEIRPRLRIVEGLKAAALTEGEKALPAHDEETIDAEFTGTDANDDEIEGLIETMKQIAASGAG